MADKRVLSIEELFDAIQRIHLQINHVRRIGLYKLLTQEYSGITEKAFNIFLEGCEVCQLRRLEKALSV